MPAGRSVRASLARGSIACSVAVLATLPLAAPPAQAVTTDWRRDVGRELRAVVVDDRGNAYVTGYVRSGARRLRTLLVVKYGPEGEKRWRDTWRPAAETQTVGNDITIRGGRIFVAGSITGSGSEGPGGWFLRAYGPGGDARWQRDQDGWRQQRKQVAALGVDAGGALVAVAVTAEGRGSFHEGSIRTFDVDGAPRWTDPFEVAGYATTYDRATDVAVSSRGVVYGVGEVDQKRITRERRVVDQEVVVQRLQPRRGDLRWTLVMKDPFARDADTATAVAIRGDVLAVTARMDGGPVTGPRATRGHAWTARIGTASGSPHWQRAFGQPNRKAAEPDAVAIGPGGTVRVAGTIRGGGDGVDGFLRSYTAAGAHQGWFRLRAGRYLHGTGVAAGDAGGRIWFTAWRGTRDDDRPAGGHLWSLRP